MSDLDNEEIEATRELNKNKYKNCEIYGVENKNEEETLKIHVQLLTKEEKREIENNLKSIVDKYTHTIVHEKDLAVSQYIIIKQEEYIEQLKSETEKKDKIIDEMAPRVFLTKGDREEMKKDIYNNVKHKGYADFVKRYFERKVEEK